MYDIITFGSATRDVFLKSKAFRVLAQKNFLTGTGLCVALGSKINVEDIFFSSGGGGTNTAATFKKQGFEVAYCGTVGDDFSGNEIIQELKQLGINTGLIKQTDKAPTNYSAVLSSTGQDRTILVYRGASGYLSKEEIIQEGLEAKWFYLAPLSGKLCAVFEDLVNFASSKGIKIAVNPGNCQLAMGLKNLKKILQKIDILILNQEEASILTGLPYQAEVEIFKKIDEACLGIAIMTKGPAGVTVSDGKCLYHAKSPKSKVVDRTGAGDSFASGFISGYLHSGGDIEESIQLGIANSTACLKEWGAKNGLLSRDAVFEKVKIQKEFCLGNNLYKHKGDK